MHSPESRWENEYWDKQIGLENLNNEEYKHNVILYIKFYINAS